LSSTNNTSGFEQINQTIGNLSNNIPTVFETIGLALLGILIPLTIAVLQDLLQKKATEDRNYSVLDLHVILDKVFQIRNLLIFVAMLFLPFIFWETTLVYIRLVELGVATIGTVLILRIIWSVYLWTKGNVSSFRKDYLLSLDKINDMIPVWASVWNNKKMTVQEEKEYFDIFSKKIDSAMKKQ
jgi:hypothetical protein